MTKDSIRAVIRRLSDLAELLDNPNLLPAVELGKKAEEVKP